MEKDETKFYKFIPNKPDDLLFHMNVISGDAEYQIAYEHSDPEGNLSKNDSFITKGSTNDSRFIFSKETTPVKTGIVHYIYIKSKTDSYIVLSVSHLSDYTMIGDATPQQVSLTEEGQQFYYMINPHEKEAKIIIEAVPVEIET